MNYLSVRNLERYQHPDIFKKSGGKPPWVRLYETFWEEDYELSQQKPATRLFALRLLNLASRSENRVPYDEGWLARRASLTRAQVRDAVRVLLAVGWLETREAVASESRASSELFAKNSPLEAEAEEERFKGDPSSRSETRENGTPIAKEGLVIRLLDVIGPDATETTPNEIRDYARVLPQASLEKVIESATRPGIRNRRSYAIKALESEFQERR